MKILNVYHNQNGLQIEYEQLMNSNNHCSLRIICTPLSVSTGWLISPTFNEKDASSNGFCISPLPNTPRSPFLPALRHYENWAASSPNFFGSPFICYLNFLILALA